MAFVTDCLSKFIDLTFEIHIDNKLQNNTKSLYSVILIKWLMRSWFNKAIL